MATAAATQHAATHSDSGAGARAVAALRRWFPLLSTAAAVCTYLLIVAGATVRVTGSGLGCPDWPTCHGRLLPPLETAAMIEFTHRFLGAVTSPLILVVSAGAWLLRRERRVLLPALALPLLLVLQIGLGAVVVWLELPPMAVLVHLGFAMLILGGLVWVAALAASTPITDASGTARTRGLTRLLAGTVVTVFMLVLTGAVTRASGASHACAGFPGCDVPTQAMEALAGGSGGQTLVHIHLLHRTVAYAAGVLVIGAAVAAWRRGGPLRPAALALGVAVLAQLAIGVAAVSTGLPAVLRGAHVAGAAAVWAFSVLLLATERRGGALAR